MSSRILILYSTVDGQTRRICQRLQQIAEHGGHAVTLASLEDQPDIDPRPFDKVVVGASIRYGKHRPQVIRFMNANRQALEKIPTAFFSVNVVARKPQKNTPDTNPYMRKILGQFTWRPRHLGVFAGKLDYPRYGFWDRAVIRFIMWITQGPTDPTAVVEFTDWNEVEKFGRLICTM